LIVPPGYTRAVVVVAGNNPCGASYPGGVGDAVRADALTAAHYQGFRLAQYAGRLVAPMRRSAEPRDGASNDPLALDHYDPPNRFAWQARHASP
jgi:hypothetical protein